MKKLLLIDFGSDLVKNIQTILKNNNIGCDLVDHNFDASSINEEIAGIIFSGSPDTLYAGGRKCQSALMRCNLPMLGICYGHQILNYEYGGKVVKSLTPEDKIAVDLYIDEKTPLFENIDMTQKVGMYHNDEVSELGEGFRCVAHTNNCRFAATYNPERNIYTLQFHPESDFTQYMNEYFINFAKICGL